MPQYCLLRAHRSDCGLHADWGGTVLPLAGLALVWADDLRLVAGASLLGNWQHWEDQIRIPVVTVSADPAGHVGESDM